MSDSEQGQVSQLGKVVAILGAGGWGTAIARILADDPTNEVRLWCRRPNIAEEMARTRENARLLPGVTLPERLRITANLAEAVAGSSLWILGIPMVYLRQMLTGFTSHATPSLTVLSLTKGMETHSGCRASGVIRQTLNPAQIAVMSGPSHCEEVARGRPTSLVVASDDHDFATAIQSLFTTDRFRVYTSEDLIGVELAGALKNVIGLAAGACDGLGFGDNAKSALLTRGLVEMTRFGIAMGAKSETFEGLAGMGDLITTCFSPHGRNRRVGERLGRGESLAEILSEMPGVAEGVETCRAVHQQAARMGVEMPITEGMFRVLFEGQPPLQAVEELMMRPPKRETEGF